LWTALLAVLPFLLWGLNGEAVLWRSATAYPLAALLSIAGLSVVTQAQNRYAMWTGAVLTGVSVLANQSGAMLGPASWVVVTATDGFRGRCDRSIGAPVRAQAISVASCMSIAAAISFGIARHFCNPRAAFTTQPFQKALFFGRLQGFLWWNPDLPLLPKLAQVGLLVLFVGGIAYAGRRGHALRPALFAVLLIAIVPFAAVLVVAESWPSLRIYYVAPITIGAIFVWIEAGLRSKPASCCAYALLLVLVGGFVTVSWQNAHDSLALYRADCQRLAQIESEANQLGIHQVFWVDPKMGVPSVNYNPYHLRYVQGDWHLSSFLLKWAGSFIHSRSLLIPADNAHLQRACLARLQGLDHSRTVALSSEATLCIFPL
jgi:hypothetical protein